MPECDTRIRPGSGTLADATDAVNRIIRRALVVGTNSPPGRQRADRVYLEIGAPVSLNPGNADFNKSWIEKRCEALPKSVVFPVTQAQTKYNGVTYGVWSPRVLSPTLRIGNVHIGLDKLGHFAQQGHSYYFLVEKGGSVAEAEAWGRQSEAGGTDQAGGTLIASYGLRSTGVYSNADLAANRAGYDFYRAIHNGLLGEFDIRNFVTADWNEEYKVNHYHEQIWETVWRNLVTGNWSGHFTRPGGQRTNLTMQLTGGADKRVVGSYVYTDATGMHRGRLNGTLLPFTPRPGSPVAGVYVFWTWTRGRNSGKGLWAARDNTTRRNAEHVFSGTWGFAQNSRDGGEIVISRT